MSSKQTHKATVSSSKAPKSLPVPVKSPNPNVIKSKEAKIAVKSGQPVLNPASTKYQSGTPGSVGSWSGEFMNRHNSYLDSLRNPLQCPGARIPDDASSQETTTLQVIYHGQVTATSAGLAGVALGLYNHNTINGPFMVPQNGMSCTINGLSIAGATHLETNVNTDPNTGPPFSDAGAGNGSKPVAIPNLANFLDSYTQYARVVSAGLKLRTTGNYTNNQGYFVSGSLPSNFFLTNLTSTLMADYQNAPGALTVSCIEAIHGVEATYTPFDNRCLQYMQMHQTGSIPNNDDRALRANPGILFAMALGQEEDVIFLYDLVLNYEVIVKTGQIAFGARPSFEDPLALSVARNARANDALTTAQPSMFNGGSEIHASLETTLGSHPRVQALGKSFGDTHSGGLRGFSMLHLFSSPVRINGLGSKRKGGGAVKGTVQSKDEKPMFESLVDSVVKIASKVAPALLALL